MARLRGLLPGRGHHRDVGVVMAGHCSTVGITGSVLEFWHGHAVEHGESITAIVGDLLTAVADGSVRLVEGRK